MKKIKYLVLMALLISFSTISSNEKACAEIEQNLKIIHDFVFDKDQERNYW